MERNKIGYIITISVISAIILISTLIILNQKPIIQEKVILRSDLPIDDMFIVYYDKGYAFLDEGSANKTINADWLSVGCYNKSYRWSILKFNLTNKPESWTMCEIQLYIVHDRITQMKPLYYYNLFLDYNDWNENMFYDDFMETWSHWNHSIMFNDNYNKFFEEKLGYLTFDITDYIEDHNTITIRLKEGYPNGFNYSSYAFYSMWSKESDVDIEYKPLLVWSK